VRRLGIDRFTAAVRREQLSADATAAMNQVRDLLECAWPAVHTSARPRCAAS
jgi:hypothetical protein